MLEHSPADVLARVLAALGLGTLALEDAEDQARTDWAVKVSKTPDKPDRVIVLTDTAGRDLGRPGRPGRRVSLYGVQIKVRAATHPAGWAKCSQLLEQLSLRASVYDRQVSVGSAVYVVHSVQFTGPPLVVGVEPGTSRRVFTLNALAGIRQL